MSIHAETPTEQTSGVQSRGALRAKLPSAALSLATFAIVVAATVIRLFTEGRFAQWALVMLLAVPPLTMVAAWRKYGKGWLASPSGLVNLYVYVSLGIYSVTSLSPENLRGRSFLGTYFAEESGRFGPIFAAAFAAGTIAMFNKRRPERNAANQRSAVAMRRLARWGLAVSAFYFLVVATQTNVSERGLNQLERDFSDSIRVAAVVASTALAVALMTLGMQLGKIPAGDYLLVLAGPVFVAAAGNRALLFSILILLWVLFALRKKVNAFLSLAAVAIALVINQAILTYRSGLGLSSFSPWDAWLQATGTSARNLALVVTSVPETLGFQGGSTYLVALTRLVPGQFSQLIFGDFTAGSGAYLFRQILGSKNPNQGFGFSLPGEAYLNFGLMGILGVGFAIGLLSGFLWSRGTIAYFHPMGALYLVFVASMPLALRSDSVGFLKTFVYSIVLLGVLWLVGQRAGPALGANAPASTAVPNKHGVAEASLANSNGSPALNSTRPE